MIVKAPADLAEVDTIKDGAEIAPGIVLDFRELVEDFVRASGPGGQNVNKVATAVALRWDIRASALPEWLKEKLLARRDRRLTKDGVMVLSGQRFRTQERNRQDARDRLIELLIEAAKIPLKRIATRPSRGATRRRLTDKSLRGDVKVLRSKPDASD